MAKRKKKRVKKWIQKMHDGGPRKGRFTAWCKAHGFGGPTGSCIAMAMKSKSKSVRGMAAFAKRAKSKRGFKKKV